MYRALTQDKPLRRVLLLAGILASMVLAAPVGAGATSYTFTTLEVPGAVGTHALGLNDAGQIVGVFFDSAGTSHPFVYTPGSGFAPLLIAGIVNGQARGINNTGQITGSFEDSRGIHGFVATAQGVTVLDAPGALFTVLAGSNDAGQIVGRVDYAAGPSHGVVYMAGSFTPLDVPDADGSEPYGINNAGEIVGMFIYRDDPNVTHHGFLAPPTSIAFAAFTATLELKFGPRIDAAFALQSRFTLGTGSHGIDLSKDAVTLALTHGTVSFTTTIPAGSFTKDKRGRFMVKGTINGVKLDATLTTLGGDRYAFTAEGKHADLSGLAHPVTVTLTIGDDRGRTTGTAEGKHPHDERS